MRGWLVMYSFGGQDVLPKHYKTEKMAVKFADEHRSCGPTCDAVVINIMDLVEWINGGVNELERMFRL